MTGEQLDDPRLRDSGCLLGDLEALGTCTVTELLLFFYTECVFSYKPMSKWPRKLV